MDPERCQELLKQMVSILRNFDVVIYYKGGAGKVYAECIEKACNQAGISLVSFGYANMGDIKKLEKVLKNVQNPE